jgi:RNA polymerase sigma factor (sigma-70 family)
MAAMGAVGAIGPSAADDDRVGSAAVPLPVPTPGALAFADFWTANRDAVARGLAVTLGDDDLGVEAADEAMARALARWDQVRGHTNPAGWTYVVGLNWARSRLRRRRREELRAVPADGLAGSAALVDEPSFDPHLQAAIDALPLDQRVVVVLRLGLDWSTAEVAAALEVAEGTVKSRLSRALARLAAELGEESP